MYMENEEEVTQDLTEEVSEEQEQYLDDVSEDEETPETVAPEKTTEKTVPYSRFKEVNEQLKKLKEQPVKTVNKSLDIEDYIDISASLEGLDKREKERLAKEHKLTGKPLAEIRNDADYLLWQKAYRAEAEQARQALAPSGKQSESERPMSFTERLLNASMEEKEKILTEAGMYKQNRPRQDRVNLRTGK